MSIEIRRRHFLAASLGGAAAMALPGQILAATAGQGFTHGVASGEPGQASMLLWTRYRGGADQTELAWEIAEDTDFGRIVGEGTTLASEPAGHCAKAMAEGLQPATWYYYRFRAPNGDVSPTGRTRTLPAEGTTPFGLAFMSCSNLPFGYFNAYAHAAKRDDIHLVAHLGDYIYEYPNREYPARGQGVAGRTLEPDHEILSLADYHARYAVYRADRDLQLLHQRFPTVTIWDDHEIANDAWKDGAENHQPETEGDWEARKAAAMAAYHHWLPMSDEPFKAYEIGDLATLFRLDTRLLGRDEQIDLRAIMAQAGSFEAALDLLRNDVWIDPERQLLGARQERWLLDGLKRSVSGGKPWQVLAQQVVMGSTYTPAATTEWIDPNAGPGIMQRVQAALGLASAGIPNNLDAWGGYPAARSRLLRGAQDAAANLVVLAGDSHNGWAFNLAEGERPAGVEFGVQSVTSPGYEAYFTRTDPAAIEQALIDGSSELAWCDTSNRGYAVLTLEAEQARGDYVFVDTIREPAPSAARKAKSFTVAAGTNRLAAV